MNLYERFVEETGQGLRFTAWNRDRKIKKKHSQNLKNKNQPKYASAISGGNAEDDDSSLGSRYDSKKADTYNLNNTTEVQNES